MEIVIGLILIAVAYLLGSIPFGLILTKKAGLGDIRQQGSGNIGATNVLRTGNKKLALATLALDGGKGALAVGLVWASGVTWALELAAIAAVMGHIFPYWLQFKGGKGVATTLAVYWVAHWPTGLFASIMWLLAFYLTRISSFASLVSMITAPIVALYFGNGYLFWMAVINGGVVIYRHKDNIHRLLRGQEKPFGQQ